MLEREFSCPGQLHELPLSGVPKVTAPQSSYWTVHSWKLQNIPEGTAQAKGGGFVMAEQKLAP